MTMSRYTDGPAPGTAGAWERPKGLPPDAVNLLTRDGIDPTDADAVLAYFTDGSNGEDGEPYWLADRASANGLTSE